MLAGCLDPATSDDLVAEAKPLDLPGVTVEHGDDGAATYTIDQSMLGYQDAFVAFAFEAQEPLRVDLDHRLVWAVVTGQSHCAAIAVNANDPLMTLAVWSAPVQDGPHARAVGTTTSFEVLPKWERSIDGAMQGTMTASGEMGPGERFTVMLGGDTADVFDIEGAVASSGKTVVGLSGAHSVERSEGRLSCGVGAADAQGSTVGATLVGEVEMGGHVALETMNASSAFVVPGQAVLGVQDLELMVPGETARADQATGLSVPRPGEARLAFHMDSGAVQRTAWLFADAYWATDGMTG